MPARSNIAKTRICFVTGTRAEFGLMHSVLAAVREHPRLTLQIIKTGMHLDPAHHGAASSTDAFPIDVTVPWPAGSGKDPTTNAVNTAHAAAGLAEAFRDLKTDVVLVVGDRVEAFAAATAAHLSHLPLAHVHGGDRALGQTDDSVRHAITKLAHIHFPATRPSAKRIRKLGEDSWRIHAVGSPGIDGITDAASALAERALEFPQLRLHRYALLLQHPTDARPAVEADRARTLYSATRRAGFEHVVVIYPNNDPGSAGIIRMWKSFSKDRDATFLRDIPRPMFLALMRDAAALVGNSSGGIIEAASFDTPVLDVGERQLGRERSRNVTHVDLVPAQVKRELKRIGNNGSPKRPRVKNVYGGRGAGEKIAALLASLPPRDQLLRKLITY